MNKHVHTQIYMYIYILFSTPELGTLTFTSQHIHELIINTRPHERSCVGRCCCVHVRSLLLAQNKITSKKDPKILLAPDAREEREHVCALFGQGASALPSLLPTTKHALELRGTGARTLFFLFFPRITRMRRGAVGMGPAVAVTSDAGADAAHAGLRVVVAWACGWGHSLFFVCVLVSVTTA